MTTIEIKVGEQILQLLGSSPEERSRVFLVGAVIETYRVGRLSQAESANILGISQNEFISMLRERQAAIRGRWVSSGGTGRTWVGENWPPETRGEASVYYSCDKVYEVQNCLVENGMRTTVTRRLGDGGPTFKYKHSSGRVISGEIRILEDDVIFEPVEYQPARRIPHGPAPNLERDLLLSPRIKELVADRDFAWKLAVAIGRYEWTYRNSPEHRWSCSSRYAGGIVAALRDLGEEYMDFASFLAPDAVDPIVRAELLSLGWIEAFQE